MGPYLHGYLSRPYLRRLVPILLRNELPMNKDIKKLFKKASKLGWTQSKGKGHYLWYSPCGKEILTVSASPSDVNAVNQIRRQMRKLGYNL